VSIKDDLSEEVAAIFRAQWTQRDGNVVPSDDSIKLNNDGIKLDATVLYADLADSTQLVDKMAPWFAAEIYKTFLRCAAKIIRSEQGTITAYDGDRVMGVFIGDSKNTSAVRASLKINWAVVNIIRPACAAQYPKTEYLLKHVVGIDTSPLFVARTGIRGANDLVWVGRAANHAAKLAALPENFQSYISSDVFDNMNAEVKVHAGRNMWEKVLWNFLLLGVTLHASYFVARIF
jgi:class 3 adenylate cyclase